MMDFDNVLNIATQNKGGSNATRRYSLQAGPPKKDPRAKAVNPNAVQALLKKRNLDARHKELEMKKQKEELLAKRVEMKSDRKARAMASRTKDNFHGYNGIPLLEPPKKKRSKHEDGDAEHAMGNDRFRNYADEGEDDEDNYEYDASDSEPEPEPEPVQRPGKPSVKKPNGAQKSAAPAMNFADLLKLAEKKQFEPVDLKPKIVKKEERLRTADEIRELEMEQKARRKDPKMERDRDNKSNSMSARKGNGEKEQKNIKPQKGSSERPGHVSGAGKKSHPAPSSEKNHVPSKPSSRDRDGEGPKMRSGDKERPKTSVSAGMAKLPLKTSLSQVSAKQSPVRTSSGHKSSASSDSNKNGLLSPKGRPASATGSRPSPGQRPDISSSKQQRLSQGSSIREGPAAMGHRSGKGEPVRSGGSNSGIKPSSGGPSRAGNPQQARPRDSVPAKSSLGRPGGSTSQSVGRGPPGRANPGGGSVAGRPTGGAGSGPGRPMGTGPGRPPGGRGSGPGRPPGAQGSGPGRPPGAQGSGPGRPPGAQGSGPGRPSASQGSGMSRPAGGVGSARPMGSSGAGLGRSKCTVMSETISSKNVGGSRPGGPLRPGMQQRPGFGPRPGGPPRPMNRPPGTMLPPITSAYKRRYDDEEDEEDSEMEDFIDDVDEEQEEVSKHIREIFGYDRKRYKDESDYALKFMESSWKDLQKEEARSLKLAVQEDLEEERKEVEEIKRNEAKRKKRN